MAHRISLGSGSPEGENSAYVLPDRGVVVDPGPPVTEAWDRLRAGIEDAGLPLDDVEYVFVTHWHADHAGLAPRLADVANATVVMHEADAPLVAEYAAERERRVERDARRLREWGVPESVVADLRAGDRPSPVPDSFPVEFVADGDRVAGIDVLHTPGHTLGHAAFACSDESEQDAADVFVGDLVLPTYTPNVGGGDTRLDDALATYLGSLTRLRERGVEMACPGHGSPLAFDERVDEIVAHHDERSRRTVRALDEVGAVTGSGLESNDTASTTAATPWDVARALFGELAGIHAKMGAGEAASHLDYLQSRGAVEQVGGDDTPNRYRVVDAGRGGIDGVETDGVKDREKR